MSQTATVMAKFCSAPVPRMAARPEELDRPDRHWMTLPQIRRPSRTLAPSEPWDRTASTVSRTVPLARTG